MPQKCGIFICENILSKFCKNVLTSWLICDNIIDSEQPLKTITERIRKYEVFSCKL